MRRDSTALHARVAATAKSSPRSRHVSCASANGSGPSSPAQSAAVRSRTISTSQLTGFALPTTSVTPAPWEAEIAVPSPMSPGLPSPRCSTVTGRSSIRLRATVVCPRLGSAYRESTDGFGSTAHLSEPGRNSATCRSR